MRVTVCELPDFPEVPHGISHERLDPPAGQDEEAIGWTSLGHNDIAGLVGDEAHLT